MDCNSRACFLANRLKDTRASGIYETHRLLEPDLTDANVTPMADFVLVATAAIVSDVGTLDGVEPYK